MCGPASQADSPDTRRRSVQRPDRGGPERRLAFERAQARYLRGQACPTLCGSRHEGEVCMADMKTWGMYIGGEWVESGETEPNINPSNGETADHVQIGTREDADRAVD